MDSTPPGFRQDIVTVLGHICLSGRPGYENLMLVSGRIRLIRLLRGALGDLAADLRAFLAELEDAQWSSEKAALKAYPLAEVDAHRLTIPLDEQHCVVVALNYQSGIALIEFAGLKVDRLRNPLRRGARS
ncbi:hypothetical protein ACVISU_005008 [Bradyrhizobium sp. USDA 4452]